MAVTEMKKLNLLAPKKEADKLVAHLMWTGSVEVTDPQGDELPMASAFAEELSRAVSEKSRVEEALRLLKPYSKSYGGMFGKRDQYPATVFENARAELDLRLPLTDEVRCATEKLQQAQNDLIVLKDKIAALRPWMGYDLPLATAGSQRTKIMMGTLPVSVVVNEVESELMQVSERCHWEWVNTDDNSRFLWILADGNDTEALQNALLPMGYLPLNLSTYGMITAPEAAEKLQADYEAAEVRRTDAEDTLHSLGEQAKELRLAADLADSILVKAEAKQKLLCTKSTVLLSGWIPAKQATAMEEQLADLNASGKLFCAWEFSDPAEGDDVPVLLQNGKISTSFEPVVAMYALPAYKTFDPTQIMSVFYFIIFGLMFGDAIYGLILILAGLVMPRYMNLSPTTKKMFNMFGICGFSSLISGILFGSYCGNMLVSVFGLNVRPILFDIVGIDALPGMIAPLNGLVENLSAAMVFLLIAVAIGAIHILVGMGVKFYVLCKEGKPFDAIVDVGSWYLIFAGIAIALLVHLLAGVIVIGIGVALIVFFHAKGTKNPIMRILKGLLGLYDVVNFLSDLMSYSRIMALGLSSAIIAMVVNMLATMVGSTAIGMIFLPVVLIVGHVINIALNLLGTFVHTSRLQYIEFFGKFYIDGGRQFKPLAMHPAYTGIVMDEINQKNH